MIRVWTRSHCSALAAALSIAATVTTLSAQTPATSDQPIQDASLTTLSGCVDADKDNQRMFTIQDQGERYALKGFNMRDYLGKKVEVTGFQPKGLKVVGGLYPNANVAGSTNTGGQAGGASPTQAAMAAQAGPNQNLPRPPIEFTVKTVKMVGACPPQK
jgi:hypothetical protein